jgi:Fe-S cluster assembly protein SufD
MKQIILDLTKNTEEGKVDEIEISEDTEILGLFAGKGDAAIEKRLKIIHKKPNLNSNILVKAVLWDKSHFDFEGDLVIERGARNTNTYLKADVLILSDRARARAVPSLEISEDEVKGGHGATVGQVDEEQLFYLTSRGLSHKEAEKVLVDGFLRDLVEKVDDPEIRSQMLKEI